jgi:glutamyl-tRNA synthetase
MFVRTRFAPSPTGYLHIGGARTALYSWLYARKHGGTFVLRIEDTDVGRSTPESANAILEGMAWLGLDYDQGPYFQTQRLERYREIVDRLLEEGRAYRCYCTKEDLDAMRATQLARREKPRYDGRCRSRTGLPPPGVEPVVRLKTPRDGHVVVDDLVKGKVLFQNSELDDLVLARSDGTPTYNFAVVVDDWDMGVTHVVRGDDHLNNTPRQINILKALSAPIPVHAHIPMILGEDAKRLSKRHGAVSVMQYREDGYLPEALLNYLVRLGWSYGDQEVFSVGEMIERFDLKDIHRSPAIFNPGKLLWLNQHYLKSSDAAHVARHLAWHMGQAGIDPADGPDLLDVVLAQRERAKTLVEMAANSAFIYRDFEGYDAKDAAKHLTRDATLPLGMLRERLAGLERWNAAAIHEVVQAVADACGIKVGKLAQPLRVALAGRAVSPPIDVTTCLVGRDKTVQRITQAMDYVRLHAPAVNS